MESESKYEDLGAGKDSEAADHGIAVNKRQKTAETKVCFDGAEVWWRTRHC